MSKTVNNSSLSRLSFTLIIVGVILCWLLVGRLPFWLYGDMPSRGQYGDTFGMVNSLFSALGVAGVAYALILQQRELRQAREETDASRAHAAELTMLAALVHARSSILQTDHSRLEEVERQARIDMVRSNNETADLIAYRVESHKELLKESLAEVKALINYSEEKSGWGALKLGYFAPQGFGEKAEIPEGNPPPEEAR